ncbi:MAG: hypothetical protein ABWX93_07440 [Pseudoxanthomonas sp.]
MRSRFYLGMTLSMAAIVLIGFFPTLFGRALVNVPKMPAYLYLHGSVLAAWFALLVTQATLVGREHLATHRRIGWASLAFLILIPLAGMGTQLAMPGRLRELGALEQFMPLVQTIFWLNLFSASQFVGFVGAAVLLRNRSESHKRLMLFGSIAIILPAAARLSRWPIFGNTATDLAQPSSRGNDVFFALGFMLLFVGAIVVNDLLSRRRLHRVTVIGSAVLIGMALLVPVIANSQWGKAIVGSLI